MYKMCKTEQSALRQRELEDGLLKAMSVHHYDDISVSDLCEQMNIPRKSFYRYFNGKDGALHALIDHTLMEFESCPNYQKRGANRTPISDLETFFEFWMDQKPLLDALERSSISGILVTRAIEHALSDASYLSRFQQQMDPVTREHATTFGVCGLMSMVLNWHHSGYQMPMKEMAEIAATLLTSPLFFAPKN